MKIARLLSGVCLAAAVAIGSLASAKADQVDATIVAGHPPVFLWVKLLTEAFIPAANTALEGTGDTINWNEAYGGTLAKVGGEIDALDADLAQIGVVSSLFAPTLLPLQNVTYVTPFGSPDVDIAFGTVDRLHDEIPEMREAWEKLDLEYISGGFGLEDYLLMTKFPVTSIADLKGMKIGAPGPAVNWLKNTGAVGVSGNLTTYYNDLQTGVIDGVIVFSTAAAAAKLHEQAPHVTITNFGAQYAGAVVAKKSWFDAQPDSVKNAIREGVAAFSVAYKDQLRKRIAGSYEAMKAGGAHFSDLSDAAKKEWADALPPLAREWAGELDSQGLAGSKVLETYMNKLRDAGYRPVRAWDEE